MIHSTHNFLKVSGKLTNGTTSEHLGGVRKLFLQHITMVCGFFFPPVSSGVLTCGQIECAMRFVDQFVGYIYFLIYKTASFSRSCSQGYENLKAGRNLMQPGS